MENQQPISVSRFKLPEDETTKWLVDKFIELASTPEGKELLKKATDQISHDPYSLANKHNQTGA